MDWPGKEGGFSENNRLWKEIIIFKTGMGSEQTFPKSSA